LAGAVGECSCGAVELVVEPDGGGDARGVCGRFGRGCRAGSGIVALEVELVLERPEDRFDALADGGKVRSCAGFVLAVGSEQQRAVALGDRLELSSGIPFVGRDHLTAVPPDRQQSQRDVAFLLVAAGARIAARGVPSGAASRCRRMPQNQREWLRQYP
jgi:hypothetical protein